MWKTSRGYTEGQHGAGRTLLVGGVYGSLTILGQTQQPVGDQGILAAQPGLVPVARLTDSEQPTSQPDTDRFLCDGLLRHLTAARRLHHFFSMASLSISALSRSSAYIFFRRRFSSSSSLSRVIMDASMPPNLDRHL